MTTSTKRPRIGQLDSHTLLSIWIGGLQMIIVGPTNPAGHSFHLHSGPSEASLKKLNEGGRHRQSPSFSPSQPVRSVEGHNEVCGT